MTNKAATSVSLDLDSGSNEKEEMKVKFIAKEDQEDPLIGQRSDETFPDKSKKPFKVHYYRDEKSLQLSLDFSQQKDSENGMFSQLRHISFYQCCLAEFLGTYLLVLFAVGFGLNNDSSDVTGAFTGSLTCGLLISALVWAFGHVSGCHINPAVSCALLVSGNINFVRALFFILCQLIGSCMAVITLRNMILVPESIGQEITNGTTVLPQIGLTLLNPRLTFIQGFGIEVIITFILLVTIMSSIDSKRTDLGGSFPLSIGLAVFIGALFGGPFTGGSMNPARSFGPAFMAGNLENHFTVYWLGPIAGGVLGAVIYQLLTFKSSVKVQ